MFQKNGLKILITVLFGLIISSCTLDKSKDDGKDNGTDQGYIGITGRIVESDLTGFKISYNDNFVIVDFNDVNKSSNNKIAKIGYNVTVFGEIDQNFYDKKTIKPTSIYIHDTNSLYFADVEEDDDFQKFYSNSNIINIDDAAQGTLISVSGIVKNIDKRKFILSNGYKDIAVDTTAMNYDPFSDKLSSPLKKGDRVYISGNLDKSFFEFDQINAVQIITINRLKPLKFSPRA